MTIKTHHVNLDLPPHERWKFLNDYQSQMNNLLSYYLRDLDNAAELFDLVSPHRYEIIPEDYLAEIDFIASLVDFSVDEVVIANLYYDILKAYWGCTAFAFARGNKVFHARNLDWWTENDLLSKHSIIFHFQRSGQTVFKSVGWPGFIGVLSGIKPYVFSITMNAVLSHEPPEIALPITFMIRNVLTTTNTFTEAKTQLETQKIASDALILLSGTCKEELAVIERTPTTFATRTAENNFIAVTNDYQKLENQTTIESALQRTSCGRYEQACQLFKQLVPKTMDECLAILRHEKVVMGITVQQMVFENNSGTLIVTPRNSKNPLQYVTTTKTWVDSMIAFQDVTVRRDGRILFENVNFQLHPGQHIGLTGNNGTGKSTLFAVLLGELANDLGEVKLPDDWQIAHMAQEVASTDMTALDYVLAGDAQWSTLRQQIDAPDTLSEHEIATCYQQFEEIDGYRAPSKAAMILSGLGFSESQHALAVGEFSGGWRMRLNLARTLMCRADVMLLDEPTNHLDLDAILWLEDWIASFSGMVLLISHDQRFLDACVSHIVHIENQAVTLYSGNYSQFIRTRCERLAQQQQAYEKQQTTRAHLENYIRRFGAKASKAKQAQSRVKQLERMKELAPIMAENPFSFSFYEPEKTAS